MLNLISDTHTDTKYFGRLLQCLEDAVGLLSSCPTTLLEETTPFTTSATNTVKKQTQSFGNFPRSQKRNTSLVLYHAWGWLMFRNTVSTCIWDNLSCVLLLTVPERWKFSLQASAAMLTTHTTQLHPKQSHLVRSSECSEKSEPTIRLGVKERSSFVV